MIHLGSAADWVNLIDSQVPDFLDLVIASWETLPAPAANELENSITNRLVPRCRMRRIGRRFEWHEVKALVVVASVLHEVCFAALS